ncbi:MAG TPA: Hsp20/alpha crystallin family protein [Phycisphaerales bacterium]|nr:Hsp20/alpha crystallin family protein [Phycisphaerales bacterium]
MNCGTNDTCGCTQTDTTTARRIDPRAEDRSTATFRPNVDIHETGEEYVIQADVPGATPESIDLNVQSGVLTLRAGVAGRTPGDSRAILNEYRVGAYERSFRIGEGIDTQRIGAELGRGVLTLRLPKADAAKARKIEVRAV